MPSITFDFDTLALRRLRPLDLETPERWERNDRYAIPHNDKLYRPVRKFIQMYQTQYGGQYPFQMYKLLHVAGVKMLGGQLSKKQFETALFATGGLYLALDKNHDSLSIDQSFGDFTSGFSHQFGVALAVMAMSEAYKIPWDKLTPIPVKGKSTLDYEVELPNGLGWLHLEAKGTTTKSRAAARRGAYNKKAGTRPPDTAMIAVITQAMKNSAANGVIEIIDPEFELNPEARQRDNQQAGRYLHYAGVARFAGLERVARELIQRAKNLRTGQRRIRLGPNRFEPGDNVFQAQGRSIVGVQWRLGDAASDGDDVWFYQGCDVARLQHVVAGEFPETGFYHHPSFDFDRRRGTFYLPDPPFQEDFVESFLPDGSYFGVGIGQRDGLLVIDRREAEWHEGQLGRLV